MLQPSELDDGHYGAAVFGEAKERTMPTLMTRFSIAIISGVALMAGSVGEKFDAVATSVQNATNGK
jgi:pilus assembly protein Flp/PilA